MLVFLLHDSEYFRRRLSPALAGCIRARSLAPLADLVGTLAAQIQSNARRDHLTADEQPLFLRRASHHFDRRLWRHAAGELLLYTAVETPAFALAPQLLRHFLPGDLVEKLHRGSREMSFAGVPYRPETAGLHDVEDVAELARKLTSIDVGTWSADRLTETEPDERGEELEYAKQRFADLRTMFESAKARSQVIVCEEL